MSGIVLVAGLYVALVADTSSEIRVFGWVLVAIGGLGLLTAAVLRRRPWR